MSHLLTHMWHPLCLTCLGSSTCTNTCSSLHHADIIIKILHLLFINIMKKHSDLTQIVRSALQMWLNGELYTVPVLVGHKLLNPVVDHMAASCQWPQRVGRIPANRWQMALTRMGKHVFSMDWHSLFLHGKT